MGTNIKGSLVKISCLSPSVNTTFMNLFKMTNTKSSVVLYCLGSILATLICSANSFVPSQTTIISKSVDLVHGHWMHHSWPQSTQFVQKLIPQYTGSSVVLQSAVADVSETANLTSSADNHDTPSSSASKKKKDETRPLKKYDMPWSELQEWSLKDYLPKYTVQVHIKEDGRDTLQVYTLWRTLSNDVTALSGYPLKFLVDRYQEIKDESGIMTSTEILPYLDGYSFETDGGLSGRVYGIPGVAQGTRIQTTPVAGVESTLRKGYVLTEEGIVYELGLPVSETIALDGGAQSKMAERAAASIQSAASEANLSDVVDNSELVKLGALTAIVLSGTWAMEALSHHLTVNVFWV